MSVLQSIDTATCKRCGTCLEVCPSGILEFDAEGAVSANADREGLCIACGQCMAVCPTESIVIEGLDSDRDFFELPSRQTAFEDLHDLLATRRSVRVFRDKPVPREMLEKIIEAVALAPMGFPPHKMEISAVQDPDTMREILPQFIEAYRGLVNGMRNPLMRMFLRVTAGLETYNVLANHIVPMMRQALPEMENGEADYILRGAPTMLVLHADAASECHTEDAGIALTYALLAAHSLGLGATAIGLVPPVVQRNKSLRQTLQIPPQNEVLAALVVGYPKYKYRRGIRRELKNVTWIGKES
ncbi:nitroreductase family protein [bacterium]|nr:nitroreductase family protein [bacterium]